MWTIKNSFLIKIIILVSIAFQYLECQGQKLVSRLSVSCVNIVADIQYSYFLDSIGTWNNSLSCPGVYFNNGGEIVLRFSPSCTNNYVLNVNHNYNQYVYGIGIRNSTGSCTPGGFTCLTPFSVVNTSGNYYKCYYNLSLDSLSTYDILIDYDFSPGMFPGNVNAMISTPHATNIRFQNITPDSIAINWDGTFDDVIIEYGPKGFSPGTGNTTGPQGTAIQSLLKPVTILGLTNDSTYDFYLRDKCGSAYSSNSIKKQIKIPPIDSLINTYFSCGSFSFNYVNYGSSQDHSGSWPMVNCGGSCPPTSPEKILRYVPDTSGFHVINKVNSGSTSPYFHLFYKEAVLGLDEFNWQCIGTGGQNVQWSHSFGPLVAGTPYYVMIKGTQDLGGCSNPGIQSSSYSVGCPGTCPILTSPDVTSIGYTNLTVLMRQGNSLGYFLLEYGPAGFVPGTDSLPGTGGIVLLLSNLYYNYVINGLLPGTTYDFYYRQYCNVFQNYSPNSIKRSYTTLAYCSVTPLSITSNTTSNSTCIGSSVTLTQIGGLLSPIGNFKWYTDSCGGTLVGTGTGITVFPNTTTSYFVRSEDTCSIGSCASISITVDSLPTVQIINDPLIEICFGDSIILQATMDSNYSYQWKRYGANIINANQNTLTTLQPGRYSVQVSDTMGCINTSQQVRISIICYPPIDASGRLANQNDLLSEKLMIFPNPNVGMFNCVFPVFNSNGIITIWNSLGKQVYFNEIVNFVSEKNIDISEQPDGLYLLRFEYDNGFGSTKDIY
ncbi:MAG: T9SS type A sorting domain-containing protein [Bacteroidetes bacterium]|nr:T9SS type A sorting domain-containing protein [Bacteroidota bacterium]